MFKIIIFISPLLLFLSCTDEVAQVNSTAFDETKATDSHLFIEQQKDANDDSTDLKGDTYSHLRQKGADRINDPIPTYILNRITTSYREKTDESLKSYIQVHGEDENHHVIVTMSAPREGGTDSWELGILSFVDSTNNCYTFTILNESQENVLYELIFNQLKDSLIAVSLKDMAENEITHYISRN